MNDPVRVYPIRFSRDEWNIPLYCYHNCTERCSKIYQRDVFPNEDNYYLTDNPDYVDNKCLFSNKLRKTYIRLHSYNELLPYIYEPNNIVIPDTMCNLELTFPLTHPIQVKLYSDNGFTLQKLLYSIHTLYKFIYEEEEKTSTQRMYKVKDNCVECSNYEINDFVSFIFPPKTECCICFDTYRVDGSVKVIQLGCNHVFHTECIMNWCTEKNTCPLCRKDIIKCETCKGTRFIYYDYVGAVIPIYMRGFILNRNNTDGMFGIYFYDFEDLLIKSMNYNRINKILKIKIIGG